MLLSILAGGMLGLFALGFFPTRATRQGGYIGMAACVVFVTWAALTGPLNLNLGFNFRLNPLLIGIFSHLILFVAGYLASRGLGGSRPELAGLTIWNLWSSRGAKEGTLKSRNKNSLGSKRLVCGGLDRSIPSSPPS